ncbi:MAG: hypothetical protein Fur0037_29020 [Planctomycetota bacterium]
MQTSLLAAALSGAFLAGLSFGGQGGTLEAQGGRGPVNPPPAPRPEPPSGTESNPVVVTEEAGQGAAANGFLAVTGSYGVGTSVLYLVDTVHRQLAVYEARGGSSEQRRIVFVGARRIDLDLELEGYNDRSEYEYRDLKRLFERRAEKPEAGTGLTPSGHR